WHSFDAKGTLNNNPDVVAGDVDLAFQKQLTLDPGQSQSLSFYVSLRGDLASTQAAADIARAQSADAWFDTAAEAYVSWLDNSGRGRRLGSPNDALNKTYDCALIVMKNCQNPKLGTFPAATNPFAYKYWNWVRDASITAMCLDASGHPEEAARYWTWMA